MGDGVEAGRIEHHSMVGGECADLERGLHRKLRVACVVFEPRDVVEDLQAQRDIVGALSEPQGALVTSPCVVERGGSLQGDAKTEEMLGPHGVRHRVIHQLDRAKCMLPGAGRVADRVEEHREHSVTSRLEVLVIVLHRPLVDLSDQLAAGGVLADPAEDVALYELGALLEVFPPDFASPTLEHNRRREGSFGVGEREQLEHV